MTPEEKTKFEEMEARIKKLESTENEMAYQGVIRKFIKRMPNVPDTAVDRLITITIGAGGGSDTEQILDYPDYWFEVEFNGSLYWVPLYNVTRT